MLYDKKFIYKCLAGFVAMMIAMKSTGGAAFIAIFAIFIAGASKRDAVTLLYGLSMSMAMLVGNSYLMPKGSIFGLAQRSSMLLLSLMLVAQVFGQRKDRSLTCFSLMFLYLIYMLAVSFVGWCPMISLLKLILFTSVFLAFIGVAVTVANSRKNLTIKVRSMFLCVAIFFLVGSVFLIPFPGISQLTGEAYMEALKSGADLTSLFTGMTYHSQSLGPVVAAIGVALFADLLFSIKRPDKLYIALLLCVPILLWKTSSRTAMGTFIVGVLFCTQMFLSARGIKSRWKGKVTSALLMIAIFLSFMVLVLPSAREKAMGFIMKYKGSQVTSKEMNMEDLLVTRQGRWDEGIANWKRSPVIGNGFQVSESMIGMNVGFTTLSAPVEKSVWISAILEEGGVFGLSIFLIFMVTCIIVLKSTKCYVGLTCFVSMMTINFGEFTMFSMSGIGGFVWAMVFIGVMIDIRRRKDEAGLRAPPRMYGYTPMGYNPMWR